MVVMSMSSALRVYSAKHQPYTELDPGIQATLSPKLLQVGRTPGSRCPSFTLGAEPAEEEAARSLGPPSLLATSQEGDDGVVDAELIQHMPLVEPETSLLTSIPTPPPATGGRTCLLTGCTIPEAVAPAAGSTAEFHSNCQKAWDNGKLLRPWSRASRPRPVPPLPPPFNTIIPVDPKWDIIFCCMVEPAKLFLRAAYAQSGDVDDFEYMLETMTDAKQALSDSEGGESDQEKGDAAAAATQSAEGAEGEVEKQSEAPGAVGEGGEEQPKKKRKAQRSKGRKASAMEFEASRAMAAEIADAPASDQADWLWASFQQATGAGSLEREGLSADCLVELPPGSSLEERLKVLEPNWQALFCNNREDSNSASGSGGSGKGTGKGKGKVPAKGWSRKEGGSGGGGEAEPGAPALLLVSPAAMGAIKLMKHCPGFHQACRIAKLFAKHIKVPEQQELLASSVVCVATGTPNRIAKLAELEALKLHNLRYMVLDTSLDVKKRTILDIPETRRDWWQELFDKHLRPLLASGQAKLALVNSDRLE